MAKLFVDVPEDPGGDQPEDGSEPARPSFSFRGADPVEVGEEAEPRRDWTRREHSLANVVALATQVHHQLQAADAQMYEVVRYVTQLKSQHIERMGEKSYKSLLKAIDILKNAGIGLCISGEHIKDTLDLEHEGVLGDHDDRRFAALGLQLIERTTAERERWNVDPESVGGAAELPPEVLELLKQAAKAVEEEGD
jgi:hypothetical protein